MALLRKLQHVALHCLQDEFGQDDVGARHRLQGMHANARRQARRHVRPFQRQHPAAIAAAFRQAQLEGVEDARAQRGAGFTGRRGDFEGQLAAAVEIGFLRQHDHVRTLFTRQQPHAVLQATHRFAVADRHFLVLGRGGFDRAVALFQQL